MGLLTGRLLARGGDGSAPAAAVGPTSWPGEGGACAGYGLAPSNDGAVSLQCIMCTAISCPLLYRFVCLQARVDRWSSSALHLCLKLRI